MVLLVKQTGEDGAKAPRLIHGTCRLQKVRHDLVHPYNSEFVLRPSSLSFTPAWVRAALLRKNIRAVQTTLFNNERVVSTAFSLQPGYF